MCLFCRSFSLFSHSVLSSGVLCSLIRSLLLAFSFSFPFSLHLKRPGDFFFSGFSTFQQCVLKRLPEKLTKAASVKTIFLLFHFTRTKWSIWSTRSHYNLEPWKGKFHIEVLIMFKDHLRSELIFLLLPFARVIQQRNRFNLMKPSQRKHVSLKNCSNLQLKPFTLQSFSLVQKQENDFKSSRTGSQMYVKAKCGLKIAEKIVGKERVWADWIYFQARKIGRGIEILLLFVINILPMFILNKMKRVSNGSGFYWDGDTER